MDEEKQRDDRMKAAKKNFDHFLSTFKGLDARLERLEKKIDGLDKRIDEFYDVVDDLGDLMAEDVVPGVAHMSKQVEMLRNAIASRGFGAEIGAILGKLTQK